MEVDRTMVMVSCLWCTTEVFLDVFLGVFDNTVMAWSCGTAVEVDGGCACGASECQGCEECDQFFHCFPFIAEK